MTQRLGKVTIYNTFLGFKTSEVGKARLNTPLNVKVATGYQKGSRILNYGLYEDYKNILKDLEFYDLKKGKEKINRNYDLKYLTYEEVEVNDYKNIIIGYSENGTAIYENTIIGTHLETREKWTKVTPADLKKNDMVTIGLFTDVQVGDKVEWIPTIFGKEVNEWAVWTNDININIVGYWDFEDATMEDKVNGQNATAVGVTGSIVSGKIGNAVSFTGTANTYLNVTDSIGENNALNFNGVESGWTLKLLGKSR